MNAQITRKLFFTVLKKNFIECIPILLRFAARKSEKAD